MIKRLLLTACALLLALTPASAERVQVSAISDDLALSVEESTSERTVVNFEIGAYDRVPVEINGETYYEIHFKEGSNLLNKGEPSLPRICRSIIIPDDAEVQINVISAEYIDIPETPVVPSKGNLMRYTNPADIPYNFGRVYESPGWYPSKLAELRRPFILRDYRGTVIEVNAFQYNSDTKTLRVYTSVTVEVVTVGTSTINVLENKKTVPVIPEFDRLYNRRFINYDARADARIQPILTISRYAPVGDAGDMLIITYDAFRNSMLPLVEWKSQKGFRTTLVNISDIGNDGASIKTYIQDFYDNPDNNLGWVLLVGDAAQVGTMYTAADGASDPSYSKLAGDDDYPDIFIGRFSAETAAEVETQVVRTIDYEKYPSGSDWFHKATGIGSDEGDGIGHYGEIDYEHIGLIRDDLLGFTYTLVDEIYDPGATYYEVSAVLNNGRSFVNYAGHGSTTAWSTTDFGIYQINTLVNDNMLPMVISVGCVNGNFTTSTCFAEAWMRATHSGVATGAIATYMSSVNQSWAPPMDAQDEAIDLLVAREKVSVGGICFNGSCKMIDLNGSAGVDMFDTWHIFGDPSVVLRTDTPSPLTVFHASSLVAGQSDFDVEVVGEEGALCALYGDGTLYGSAYTDAEGLAAISIGQALSDGQTVTLTVTSFNAMPYITDLDVGSSGGAMLLYDEYSINDYTGNNDGHADAGESILLGVQIKNIASSDAVGVEATLTSADSYVTITDGYESFGTVPGNNGTSFASDAYALDINANTPDDYNISFNLEITGTERTTWSSDFSIPVHRPNLGVLSVIINDAAGDANGILDPGETAELIVTIGNSGSGLAGSVNGILSETDVFMSIDDPIGSFGDIPGGGGVGDNTTDAFLVTADPGSIKGYEMTFDLSLTDNNGLMSPLNFNLIIGDREEFYFDDFSFNKGWTGLGGNAEWTIGPATGGAGSDPYGEPDPAYDHTPTEDNYLLGNDLTPSPGGDYNPQLSNTYWVYSPIFDCTDYAGVQLIFYRWMGIETDEWDHAYLDVFNGTSWIHIFENIDAIEDYEWQEIMYDVSEYADYNPNFQIRFGLGTTDAYWNYCGWNIDDLTLKGYFQGESGNPDFAFSPEEISVVAYQNYAEKDTLQIFNNGDATLRVRFAGSESWINVPDDLYYIPPTGSAFLEVTLNKIGVPIGEHTGAINYSSNDRDFRSGSIPVFMTVVESYMCGDADSNETINLLDIVYLINNIYKNGPDPVPLECGDVDSDYSLNILDIIYLINFIYKDGMEPECLHGY